MIEKLLEPFGFNFAQLQDISTLLKHLKSNNKTVEDFINFIEEEKTKRTKTNKLREENALKCPECKTTMSLFPVNTNPKDQVGNDLRSQWLCPKCWYNKFSKRTTKDWLIEINKNSFV